MNDTPSIISKLNLWTYINIRIFKFRFTRNILYFIQGLNSFKVNNILYNYRDWNFEHFYFKFFKLVFFIFVFFLFL